VSPATAGFCIGLGSVQSVAFSYSILEKNMLLNDVINAFLVEYEGRDHSITSRIQFWRDAVGQHDIVDLTDDHIEAAMDRLVARGKLNNKGLPTGKTIRPSTLNRYRAALGSVLKYARENRRAFGIPKGWQSPLADVATAKESPGRLDFLTSGQIDKLVAVARKAFWKPLPALIYCAFVSGLRRGNLLEMRWRDVDLKAGTITVMRTKSGKPHVAIMTPALIAEFNRIGPQHPDSLVFESSKGNGRPHDFRHAYAKALEDAGLPAINFHALRHSCATHLAKSGANLLQIADAMTHSNLQTTRRYSHLMVDDRARMINQHFA